MTDHQASLRKIAAELLGGGQIATFIGFKAGLDPSRPIPHFARDAAGAGVLVINAFCGAGLARHVLETIEDGAVGILTRGCDGLGLERLIADERVARERLHIVAMACKGAVDPGRARAILGRVPEGAEVGGDGVTLIAGEDRRDVPRDACLLDRCLSCVDPSPRLADTWLGEPLPAGQRDFAAVTRMEQQSAEERYAFWSRQFERCLRCNACRNSCPACSCRACSLDDPELQERGTGLADQFGFHFTRAYHVAGRCVACGECQRACPMNIPLGLLNEKFLKDIRDLFGIADPHRPTAVEPLACYRPDDPEGWRGDAR
jgi:ferredoxin